MPSLFSVHADTRRAHALSLLTLISLMTSLFGASSWAAELKRMEIDGVVIDGGCVEPDGCAAVTNPVPNGAAVSARIDFTIDSATDAIVLQDTSIFRIGPHVVSIQDIAGGAGGVRVLLVLDQLRWSLVPDPAAIINDQTASAYRIDFIFDPGILTSEDVSDAIDVLTTGNITSQSIMTLFHFPPNLNVSIDSVSVIDLPPPETGIVGAWYAQVAADAPNSQAGGPTVLALLNNGQYMHGQDGDPAADPSGQDGIEWGYYTFNGSTLNFDTQLDTNGGWGLNSGVTAAVVDGNTLTLDGAMTLTRLPSDGLVGGWLADGLLDDQSVSAVFTDDGSFMLLHGNDPEPCACGQAGVEFGSYSHDDVSGVLQFDIVTDTNGEFGFSDPAGFFTLTVNGDNFELSDQEGLAATASRVASDDADGDGINNIDDNCVETANPNQNDGNGDGFGNLCDTDLNSDCSTNAIDLGLLRLVFFSANPGADFNGDGIVNVIDLGIFKGRFFSPPGPSYQTLACRG